jgi:DNA-directed RNA polymerase subunit RPC12/RpoP
VARRFTAQGRNEAFTCVNCGREVPPLVNGSCRNHCPACLHSLHVDENPGDRASECGGLLVPVAVEHSSKKGWVIVHRCAKCSAVGRNKAALDDPAYPDDYALIVALSSRPRPVE